MSLYNNTPYFLDSSSGYNEDQVNFINILVRTLRRKFESKAKQKKADKPIVTKLTLTKYNRVIDLQDYYYLGYFTLSFILNPQGMEKNGVYDLFETNHRIAHIALQGSNSETLPAASLSALGTIQVIRRADVYVIQFKRNELDWPKNGNNLVQYSTSIKGRTYDE